MVKIKIFKSSDEGNLEKGVNSYLEQIGKNNLINIKYSMTFKDNEMYHSAMIIYEEAKEEDQTSLRKPCMNKEVVILFLYSVHPFFI